MKPIPRAILFLTVICACGTEEVAPAPIEPITADQLLDIATDPDGKTVLVNFWATWCGPCVKELPDLLRVASELESQGLRLVLVSCDFEEQVPAARRLLAKKGVDFLTYLKTGKDDPFIRAIDPEWDGALPATFVYDGAGKKVGYHQGQASYEEFLDMVREAMSKRSPPTNR